LAVARSCERAAAGPRKALVAQGGTADCKIDGYTESRRFFCRHVGPVAYGHIDFRGTYFVLIDM
jgi:hypothetical protein